MTRIKSYMEIYGLIRKEAFKWDENREKIKAFLEYEKKAHNLTRKDIELLLGCLERIKVDENSKKDYQEIKNALLSLKPYHAKDFTEDEIEEYISGYSLYGPTHTTTYFSLNMQRFMIPIKDFFKKYLNKRRLIEIGAGTFGLVLPLCLEQEIDGSAQPIRIIRYCFNNQIEIKEKPLLYEIGIKEYMGVDPRYHAGLFRDLKNPKNSLYKCFPKFYENVHVSSKDALSFLEKQPNGSAVICSAGSFDMYAPANTTTGDKKSQIHHKYLQALAREVYRVTPRNNITFHIQPYSFNEYLLEAGFKIMHGIDKSEAMIIYHKA